MYSSVSTYVLNLLMPELFPREQGQAELTIDVRRSRSCDGHFNLDPRYIRSRSIRETETCPEIGGKRKLKPISFREGLQVLYCTVHTVIILVDPPRLQQMLETCGDDEDGVRDIRIIPYACRCPFRKARSSWSCTCLMGIKQHSKTEADNMIGFL